MLANHNAIESVLGGYTIERSLRFNASSSNYLQKTFSTAATNGNKYTLSMWVKRGSLGLSFATLFGADNGGGTSQYCYFNSNDQLLLDSGGSNHRTSVMRFRDISAYYHIVIILDSTLATENDRLQLWVNNTRATWTSGTSWTQNVAANFCKQSTLSGIGRAVGSASALYYDGNIADIHFIDGQALTPSSFGETNSTTGQWVAKSYSGSFGNNGFYLDFKDGTSTTTLGYDAAGSNDWTLTNFTRSAGVNDCWMLDVPAGNGSASAVQPSGNYAVLNPLSISGMTLSKGNLTVNQTATAQGVRSSIAMTTGKWVWWVTIVTGGNQDTVGMVRADTPLTTDLVISGSNAIVYHALAGNKYINGAVTAYGATYTTNDVIRVEVDIDNNTIEFFKSGTSQGLITGLSLSGNTWFAACGNANNQSVVKAFNFGQHYIAETPTTGFKALCTANLPTPAIKKPSDHFNVRLATGANIKTDSEALFTNELVWIKDRANANNHQLIDSVRGSTAVLQSNTTSVETTYTAPSGSSVGWVWRASDSAPVTNTNGSISSQVSVNPTAGFSIVTYTGTGANATVGHGLGVAPKMVIVKNRGVTGNWQVRHGDIAVANSIQLNLTNSAASATTIWNSTAPTSTVFSIGTDASVNGNTNTYVAHCFADVVGYSKFGSYAGNGSADGPFVYTGFRPRFIMLKLTGGVGSWLIHDTSRDTYNPVSLYIQANASDAEATLNPSIDITANGFKIRNTNSTWNTNGGTYIYMAFAETPFNYANAR